MTPRTVFHDPRLQQSYERLGYAVLPPLDPALVRELRDSHRRLSLEDVYGIGYRVSLYSRDVGTRRRAHETLVAIAFPAIEPFLVDRSPYMATYLVKEAGGRFIPPHQDWTHCDETRHDSLMCWVPLADVDVGNGALGFVDGSHRYFDYPRAFPYEVADTPVRRHGAALFPFLRVLPLRAGEPVVFNNRTIHGSTPNTTSEARVAFSFALHPAGEPLLGCYLKPDGRADTLLRYTVGPEFYLEYPHPRTLDLYRRGELIAGYACEEVPYRLPDVTWADLEERLVASGNRRRETTRPVAAVEGGRA